MKGGLSMVRNPTKQEEMPQPQKKEEAQNVQIIEREISLSLLNDKLNYMTGLLHKIAEACQIDLSQN